MGNILFDERFVNTYTVSAFHIYTNHSMDSQSHEMSFIWFWFFSMCFFVVVYILIHNERESHIVFESKMAFLTRTIGQQKILMVKISSLFEKRM